MIKYRFFLYTLFLVLIISSCYAQRTETDRLTVKGYFDLDKQKDSMSVKRKIIFDKDEEGQDNWHVSETYVDGKIQLGNKTVLFFTDYDTLDESRAGELTYFSPQPGIIVRQLGTHNGSTLTEVYDYYLFDAQLKNWYKYKTATYNQATWDDFDVTFDYYNKEQKALVGSEMKYAAGRFKDPMLWREYCVNGPRDIICSPASTLSLMLKFSIIRIRRPIGHAFED